MALCASSIDIHAFSLAGRRGGRLELDSTSLEIMNEQLTYLTLIHGEYPPAAVDRMDWLLRARLVPELGPFNQDPLGQWVLNRTRPSEQDIVGLLAALTPELLSEYLEQL